MLSFFSAPSRASEVVTAHNSSSTNLVVSWSHLPEKQFKGKPIGYQITFHPFELEIDVNYVSVNFATNSTTLTNLAAYTVYVINVSAVSSGGIGPANTVKARTDSEGTVESIIIYGRKICSLIKNRLRIMTLLNSIVQRYSHISTYLLGLLFRYL